MNNRKYNNLLKQYDIASIKHYLQTNDLPFDIQFDTKKANQSAFSKNRYKIKDHNGNILSKEFFGNELQLVPENTIRNENLTANKISKINKTPIVDQYVQNIIPVANRTRNNNYYEGN